VVGLFGEMAPARSTLLKVLAGLSRTILAPHPARTVCDGAASSKRQCRDRPDVPGAVAGTERLRRENVLLGHEV